MAERWQRELRKLKTLEPPPGLWDRVMTGPRREPPRPRRTWRVIAPAAAAVAVAVVAGTLALVRPSGPGPGNPGSVIHAHAGRFTDPRFGWTIRYPAGMATGHFSSNGFATSDGVRVTNFQPDLQAPSTGTPPMGWLRDFPADGVALQVWFIERFPIPPPLRDSTLPLARASFGRIRPYTGGTEPQPYYRVFYGDGFAFTAAVWLGPHASRAAVHAIWSVLGSLRFPPLTQGTIWQHRFYVLGPTSRYPTGSVTLFPARSLPAGLRSGSFYLIHAPRAFYVIDQVFGNPQRPSATCTIAFDRKAFQFFCPGTGLRWDRTGQPIGAHARGGPDWELQLRVGTVAHDGHLLYCPFFGGLLPLRLHGNPWQ
jgi:hypothetical protein